MDLIGKQRSLRVTPHDLSAPALVHVTGADVALNVALALAHLGFPREELAETGFVLRRGSSEPALAPDVPGGHYVTPHFRWEISGFWPTVAEEITLGGRVPLDERLKSILRMLRLDGLAARHPATLSGGETAKLILACHLALRPRRLVLDRVLGELDAATRSTLMSNLHAWAPEALAFIIDDTVGQGFDASVDTDGTTSVWTQGSGRIAPANLHNGETGTLSVEVRTHGETQPAHELRLTDFAAMRGERRVSAPVTFRAAGGDWVLLRGPNGCGKTSLLEALAGLLGSEGELAVEKSGLPMQAQLAFALSPQDPLADITELTLRDELALACGTANVPHLVEELGIPAQWVEARLPEDIGLQKLASVVAATARPRAVCLLDEPTIYLARSMRGIAVRAIRRYLSSGGIVVCSTHDAEFVHALERQ